MSSHIQLLQLLHFVSVLHYLLPSVNSSWDSPKPIYVYKCLVLPSVLSSHVFLKTTGNEQQRSARSLHVNCISHRVINAVTKRAVFEDLCCITAFSLMWCHSSSPDEDWWLHSQLQKGKEKILTSDRKQGISETITHDKKIIHGYVTGRWWENVWF